MPNHFRLTIFLLLALAVSVWLFSPTPKACAGANSICTATVTYITSTSARLNWTTDGTSQTQSHVIVYYDSGYTREIYDSNRVSNTNFYWDIPAGELDPGRTYYWKVEVYATWDSTPPSTWSSFALSGDLGDDAFITPTKLNIGRNVTFGQNLNLSGKWTCGDTLYDNRDNQSYATVLIGSQCWMKQGLNFGTRVNVGTAQGTTCVDSDDVEKWCHSDNADFCDTNHPNYPDGGLYQWNQAMCGSTTAGAQGICPAGWHLPTDAEMCTLEQTVDATIGCATNSWRGTDGGTKLKPNGSSGWEGNLAGFYDGVINNRTTGFFWSSTEITTNAWTRALSSGQETVYRYSHNTTYGFSARCLKD